MSGSSNYQTYTSATPIAIYRDDFIHREAMCAALAKRYPALAPVGADARAHVRAIDGRRAELQAAEDDLVRARALEEAEKLGAVDVYATLRGLVGTYDRDKLYDFLPDRPSAVGKLGAPNLRARLESAIEALRALPDGAARYAELVCELEEAVAELRAADELEDQVRARLRAVRLGMLVFKGELAAARDAQLGRIQTILEDRSRVVAFTLRWRKARRDRDEAGADAQEAEPAAG